MISFTCPSSAPCSSHVLPISSSVRCSACYILPTDPPLVPQMVVISDPHVLLLLLLSQAFHFFITNVLLHLSLLSCSSTSPPRSHFHLCSPSHSTINVLSGTGSTSRNHATLRSLLPASISPLTPTWDQFTMSSLTPLLTTMSTLHPDITPLGNRAHAVAPLLTPP